MIERLHEIMCAWAYLNQPCVSRGGGCLKICRYKCAHLQYGSCSEYVYMCKYV